MGYDMCEIKENSVNTKIITFNIDNKRDHPFIELEKIIKKDNEYSWAIFCNIAMQIYDTNLTIKNCKQINYPESNYIAARIMYYLFKVDITRHELYDKSYQKL